MKTLDKIMSEQAIKLAGQYANYLNNDNGVFSTSHKVMISHCKYLRFNDSDKYLDLYHDEVTRLLESS